MPRSGVGTWRMVSAQSVPQSGVRDRWDLVQSTAPVSRWPLAQQRGVAASGESGAADIERRWRLNPDVMEWTYSRLRARTAFLVRKTSANKSDLSKHPSPPSPLSGLGSPLSPPTLSRRFFPRSPFPPLAPT